MNETCTLFDSFFTKSCTEPWNMAISGVAGFISIICWVLLLLPQIIKQWHNKDQGDIVAIKLLFVWLLGDIINVIGSIWAGLLPQAVILAFWFLFVDFVMILQYGIRWSSKYPEMTMFEKLKLVISAAIEGDKFQNPNEPLLNRSNSGSLSSLSGTFSFHETNTDFQPFYLNSNLTGLEKIIRSILTLLVSGIIGYLVTSYYRSYFFIGPYTDSINIGPQVLGYTTALIYLVIPIPQILVNQESKTVQGVSQYFHIMSMLGSITFAVQIVTFDQEEKYILTNLPWLVYSLGSIIEDMIILIQLYRSADDKRCNLWVSTESGSYHGSYGSMSSGCK
ncbi:hypothetical protein NADFUDRAFT_44729 [Nadsonia fulvescens var. elongata DSM 6958]|uniref:PQ-loop-domain-containing protein n=1 Tax=Nadsonia fulvescens var. elongata DSM 6958 TaxID=857566 RepID=A0A1E3PS37_9ASCO|nr:hypothetical protein NADFUDRAFT_44729 [Nadsonia fulvescens var. elongata DSM 6958]